VEIGDIGFDQEVPWIGPRLFESVLGSRVCHPVHVDHRVVRGTDQVPHNRGTDEAASAGQKNPHKLIPSRPWLLSRRQLDSV
jgi:hypothetical protein